MKSNMRRERNTVLQASWRMTAALSQRRAAAKLAAAVAQAVESGSEQME
jgi:hypothetical protein